MKAIALVLATTLLAHAVSQETVVARLGSKTQITVTGHCDKPAWLGISLYGGTSVHQVRRVSSGSLNESFKISATPNRYEVALWDKKVPRVSCKTKSCQWCPLNGFHMEGMRAYNSGVLSK